MISSLFLLTTYGDVIVEAQFRERVPRACLEGFWSQHLNTLTGREEAPAFVVFNSTLFVHLRRNNLVLIGAGGSDVSPLAAAETLLLVERALTARLRELTEDAVRESFSVVYQMLQEMLDAGYPLITEQFVLDELVPKRTLESKLASAVDGVAGTGMVVAPIVPRAHPSTPWRNPQARYVNSEILLDVIESLHYILGADGRAVKAEVHGEVRVTCRLSGAPDVALTLTGVDAVGHLGFHRCARVGPLTGAGSVIDFVPPDGVFTLLDYSASLPPAHTQLPLYVTPQVAYGPRGGRFSCMVGSRSGHGLGRADLSAEHVVVMLLLPPRVATLRSVDSTHGQHTYDRAKGVLTWRIGSLAGQTPSLSGDFALDEGEEAPAAASTGPCAVVSFEIPNYSVTELRVDSIQVTNESGKSYKGIKYVTRAGDFVCRAA